MKYSFFCLVLILCLKAVQSVIGFDTVGAKSVDVYKCFK